MDVRQEEDAFTINRSCVHKLIVRKKRDTFFACSTDSVYINLLNILIYKRGLERGREMEDTCVSGRQIKVKEINKKQTIRTINHPTVELQCCWKCRKSTCTKRRMCHHQKAKGRRDSERRAAESI